MRTRMIGFVLVAAMMLVLFTGGAWAETATVNGRGVNVRSGPGMGYKVTDTLKKGTVVEILDKTDSTWFYVRYPGGTGYMSASYLSIVGPDLYLDAAGQSAAAPQTGAADVFLPDQTPPTAAAPASTPMPSPSPVVTQYPVPSPVSTLAPEYSYPHDPTATPSPVVTPLPTQTPVSTPAPVRTPIPTPKPTVIPMPTPEPLPTPVPMPHESAYPLATPAPTPVESTQTMILPGASGSTEASSGETSLSGPATGIDVVSFACRYVGYPYAWAGKDPSTGFDCSGFVWYVYSAFGYDLNRVASAQAQNGLHVDASDLRMGDILCFYTYGSYIGHSGIYIGNGKFIHAANSATGVVITDLDSYAYRYFEARRIIN